MTSSTPRALGAPGDPPPTTPTIRVLGAVELGDRPVRSSRLRRLLTALVVRSGEVASTDWLAEAVWGEERPAHVEAALQTLVSRLRAALQQVAGDGATVQTRPPGYRLELAPDQLDARRFTDLAARGRARLREPGGDAESALADFDAALALWRGTPYGDLADEEVARADAARLDAEHQAAEEGRLEVLVRLGRHAEALRGLEAATRSRPLSAEPHRLLMIALEGSGRSPEALEVFRAYRERLVDELGIDPPAEIADLHTAILRQEPSASQARPAGSPPAGTAEDGSAVQRTGGSVAPGNLPLLREELVGRADDLSAVVSTLRGHRMVTLTGPGGVGKTSVALHAAHALATGFADGAWVCGLARLAEGDAVVNALRTVLGAPARQGSSDLDRLAGFLRERRALVVLDSCEHVVGAVAAMSERLLDTCPGVTLLATSRMPVGVAGEQVVPLAPLAVPASGARAEAVAGGPAVELFVRRARSHSPDFALTAENADAVAEIVRRLDGLPLALELAASRMRAMAPQDLAPRLTWRFRLLHGGTRTADERHRALRALIDWSYELLDADERRTLSLLSVFAGPFSFADAVGVAARWAAGDLDEAAVEQALPSLVDQSMVATTAGTRRYTLLESIRAYARERLAGVSEADALRRAHAEHLAEVVEGTVGAFFTPRHAEVSQRIESLVDELRAAVGWALERDVSLAARLAGSLGAYVEHSTTGEPARWAHSVLEAWDRDQPDAPAAAGASLAGACAVAAAGARFAGALEEAERLARRGLDLGPRGAQLAYLQYLLGEALSFQGRYDEAAAVLDDIEALPASPDVAGFLDAAQIARALDLAYHGDPEGGAAIALRILAKAETEGNAVVAAWATYLHGETMLETDPGVAAEVLRGALRLARACGDRYLLGVTLVSAASVAGRHGDPDEARVLFAEVVRHWRDVGSWTQQWTTLRNILDLLVRLGRDEQAAVLLGALAPERVPVAPFGAEARRTEAAAVVLADRLGTAPLDTLRRRGAALGDEALIAHVLDALG